MPLELSNPKTFLALLLFIGFVFVLIGVGWSGIASTLANVPNPEPYVAGGVLIMILAVGLWIMVNRRRMGF
jgi:hypothetical protein